MLLTIKKKKKKTLINKQKGDVNASSQGITGLHEAAGDGNLTLVRLFLSHPDINIDAADEKGSTALSRSMFQDNIEIPKCLLDPKACNISIDYSLTKMDEKIIEKKQLQYHKGAKPNGDPSDIPMNKAALYGQLSMMKLLYKYGANINATSNLRKETPLRNATWSNRYHAMEWLIQNGADMTLKDSDGYTCVTLKCQWGGNAPKALKVLLKYNCDLSGIHEKLKQTPFQLTVSGQKVANQDLLFKHFLKIHSNEPEKIGSMLDEPAYENGGTAFHIAVRNSSPHFVHYLTQINANPTLRDSQGN